MNFIKSVFSDDPVLDVDPPDNADSNSPRHLAADNKATTDVGEWSFGGLIKSLTVRSESVIDTYRRDLKEFGSGLKKEIEVAQGSLETVGQVIDEFGSYVIKGTAQIISHGKDVIVDADHGSDSDNNSNLNYHYQRISTSKPYRRFDALVSAMQGDMNTYCEEPEELDDYNEWKLGFVMKDKNSEIDSLLQENGTVNTIYKKIVPSSVDNEAFWCRYFYRVHTLKQAEDLRVNLVKRAISGEEEELSWDVDDEEGEEEGNVGKTAMADKMGVEIVKVEGNGSEKATKEVKKEKSEASQSASSPVHDDENGRSSTLPSNESSRTNMEDPVVKSGEKRAVPSKSEIENYLKKLNKPYVKSFKTPEGDIIDCVPIHLQPAFDNPLLKDHKIQMRPSGYPKGFFDEVSFHEKPVTWTCQGCPEGTVPIIRTTEEALLRASSLENFGRKTPGSFPPSVSSQPPLAEEKEDLEWDEIEDISNIDEKKVNQSASPTKIDPKKWLNASEEDEDLSWDIEENDEPPKLSK